MNFPYLNRLNHVVAIGGGYGLGRILKGLSSNISATAA